MEQGTEAYLTLKAPGRGLFKDRSSRFLAFAYPVNSEEEIKEKIREIRKEYHDARHHCYAFRLGTDTTYYRSNDDGEPSGTAGKPILNQIISKNLTNVLIVVVRYFGGKLLGTSGLINAYRSAAADSIENATLVELIDQQVFEVCFSYEQMNLIMHIINETQMKITRQEFSDICKLDIVTDKKKYQELKIRLLNIKGTNVIEK